MLKSDYILKAKNKKAFDRRINKAVEENDVFTIRQAVYSLENFKSLARVYGDLKYVKRSLINAVLALGNVELIKYCIPERLFLFCSPEERNMITKTICELDIYELIVYYLSYNYSFLDEHDCDLITKKALKQKQLDKIRNFSITGFGLPDKNKYQITQYVCNEFDCFEIYCFVCGISRSFFSNETKDIIIQRLCDSKSEHYLFKTVCELRDITDKNKRLVAQALSGSSEYAKKFLLYFDRLECLDNETVEKMFEVIDLSSLNFKESVILSKKFPKLIETRVQESKNERLVVALILTTLNIELLCSVFGTKLAFANYCLKNKDSFLAAGASARMSHYFDEQLIQVLKKDDNLNYVDANMNSFFRESSKSIKNVKEG